MKRVIIDSKILKENISKIKLKLKKSNNPNCEIIAVVKGNGYGLRFN